MTANLSTRRIDDYGPLHPWRSLTTGRDGSFSWDRANQGGHAYTISGIDVSSDRLIINNSWDNADGVSSRRRARVRREGGATPRSARGARPSSRRPTCRAEPPSAS